MLSFTDCIGLSGLSNEEIRVIAAQARVPEIIACGLANSLLATPGGIGALRRLIEQSAAAAQWQNKQFEALYLRHVLDRFDTSYPVGLPLGQARAVPGNHPVDQTGRREAVEFG